MKTRTDGGSSKSYEACLVACSRMQNGPGDIDLRALGLNDYFNLVYVSGFSLRFTRMTTYYLHHTSYLKVPLLLFYGCLSSSIIAALFIFVTEGMEAFQNVRGNQRQ